MIISGHAYSIEALSLFYVLNLSGQGVLGKFYGLCWKSGTEFESNGLKNSSNRSHRKPDVFVQLT
jgi:hypothetical protein